MTVGGPMSPIWQKSICLLNKGRGMLRFLGLVNSSHIQVPDKERFITSLACSDSFPFLAVGSMVAKSNLYLYHTGDTSVSPTLCGSYSKGGPIYSMAWSGRTLLTGSSEGTVQIYDIEATQLQEARTALGAVRSVGKLSHRLGKAVISPPGTHIQSTRVNQVDISPGQANQQIATIMGTSVHLWDLERTDAPIRSDKVAHEMNLALQWHPQSSYGLLAAAGLDRGITVLDPRKHGKPMVWKARQAHDGIVRDIAWHPYIPYWLLSAGDDGKVQMFDARHASKPLLSIHSHSGPVHSVNWSNAHCDILAAGGEDGRIKWWQLRPSKSQETGQREVISEPIMDTEWISGGRSEGEYPSASSASAAHIIPSTLHPEIYFSATALGSVSRWEPKPDLLSMVAMHRYGEEQNPQEHAVEAAVYQRDFTEAHLLLDDLIPKLESEQRAPEIKAFKDLLQPILPIPSSSWTFSHSDTTSRRGTATSSGKMSLEGIPPETWKEGGRGSKDDGNAQSHLRQGTFLPLFGFSVLLDVLPELVASTVKDTSRARTASPTPPTPALAPPAPEPVDPAVEFRSRVRNLVEVRAWEELLTLQRDILAALRQPPNSPGAWEGRLLRDIIKCLLGQQPEGALQLGQSAVDQMGDTGLPTPKDLSSTVHMLLYPTVFDPVDGHSITDESGRPEDVKAARKAERKLVLAEMEHLLSNPSRVGDMLELEILIQRIVRHEGEDVALEIADTCKDIPTVSAGALRLYMGSLLQLRKYDEYARLVLSLLNQYGVTSFGRWIRDQCVTVSGPKCQAYYEGLIRATSRDAQSVEAEEYRDAIALILRLLRVFRHEELVGWDGSRLQEHIGFLDELGIERKFAMVETENRESQAMAKTITSNGKGLDSLVNQCMAQLDRFLRAV
ncbi:WD40-repeat-containing domain protein [Piptocephalis cylindrospora]|uniref:WD40-repeat-containing domain protein n=1 Tax=Piptocephalis cylindrospora TaxID=1907219 RepID=A0A4P9Y703_9FUNG|nr:WD40-repeat-containing domain protein [Piptocephalis cylindrospora]|eukprot:RKP14877.1 WD40-repeat-containing domain protein [Piptocephalis cylindrospora]